MKYNKSDSVSDILDSLRKQKKQRDEQASSDTGHIISKNEYATNSYWDDETEASNPARSYTRFIVILILAALAIGGIFFYIGTKGTNREQTASASPDIQSSSDSSLPAEESSEFNTTASLSDQSKVNQTTSAVQTETTTSQVQTTEAQITTTVPQTSHTEAQKASLSGKELGFMYNLFYVALAELPGDMGEYGGWITDYNGDGTDDLIIQNLNRYTDQFEYFIYSYKNGDLQKSSDQAVDKSALNSVPYYNSDALKSVSLSYAQNNGYAVNTSYDNYFGYAAIGYVKTNGFDSNLNLRAQPNTSSDVIVKLPNRLFFGVEGFYDDNGAAVDEWSKSASWLKIYVVYNYNSYEGYVSRQYVKAWVVGV